MRVRRTKEPLPTKFTGGPWVGILMESDIKIEKHSRLSAKLLVFDKQRHLRSFWKAIGKGDLGPHALGCVNALSTEVIEFEDNKESGRFIEVDPKYFCIIGLVSSKLYLEIICHESIHAGFAYSKRRKGDFWITPQELDEESVCYPSGILSSSIHRALAKHDMYRFTKFGQAIKARKYSKARK